MLLKLIFSNAQIVFQATEHNCAVLKTVEFYL